MLEIGREKMREEKSALFYTNKEINALQKRQEETLIQLQNTSNAEDYEIIKNIADNITSAIELTKVELEPLKKKEAERLIFRSRAQWTEEGEKSSRYFLNLIKDRQNKMLIRKIISNGTTFHKQDEITKAITNFYKDLYKKQPNLKTPDSGNLLHGLPTLSDEQKAFLESPLTLDELTKALNTCNESAPGFDGISYDTYKALWDIVGPFVLSAWIHSTQIKETSSTQKLSIISLLEKKRKR